MSFTEFMRPIGTGTTAEAVGTRDAGINLPAPHPTDRDRERVPLERGEDG
jgi:hypothetical protein